MNPWQYDSTWHETWQIYPSRNFAISYVNGNYAYWKEKDRTLNIWAVNVHEVYLRQLADWLVSQFKQPSKIESAGS